MYSNVFKVLNPSIHPTHGTFDVNKTRDNSHVIIQCCFFESLFDMGSLIEFVDNSKLEIFSVVGVHFKDPINIDSLKKFIHKDDTLLEISNCKHCDDILLKSSSKQQVHDDEHHRMLEVMLS